MWHPDTPIEYRNVVVTGDARVLSERIPDESVDLVFTDPLYDRMEDYEWLARLAARVLKPNSAALVFCGIGYLPQTLDALRSGGLSFRWQFVLYMPGQNQRGAYKTFSNWKCLLWLEKGTRHPTRHIRDLILDRSFRVLPCATNHGWTKNPDTIAYYMSAFSDAAQVVLDPTCGGGTIPAVCKMLSRNWVASEIDPDTAERARERVLFTQPPLFVQEPEQAALGI